MKIHFKNDKFTSLKRESICRHLKTLAQARGSLHDFYCTCDISKQFSLRVFLLWQTLNVWCFQNWPWNKVLKFRKQRDKSLRRNEIGSRHNSTNCSCGFLSEQKIILWVINLRENPLMESLSQYDVVRCVIKSSMEIVVKGKKRQKVVNLNNFEAFLREKIESYFHAFGS